MLWCPAEFLCPRSVVYSCVISQPHRLTQIAWCVTPVHFYRMSKINKTRSRTLSQTGSTPTCCECDLCPIIWNHQATGGALLTEPPSACDLQFILHLIQTPSISHCSQLKHGFCVQILFWSKAQIHSITHKVAPQSLLLPDCCEGWWVITPCKDQVCKQWVSRNLQLPEYCTCQTTSCWIIEEGAFPLWNGSDAHARAHTLR